MIEQETLMRIYCLRERRRQLDRESRAIKLEEDKLAVPLVELLRDGTRQEKGKYKAELKAGDRRPSWKDAFVEIAGKDAADKLIAQTEPKPELVIVDVTLEKQAMKLAEKADAILDKLFQERKDVS